MTKDEVLDAARERRIADITQVHVGVLEADGKFSFIRKDRLPAEPAPESSAT